jgi:hypothetical protein
MYQAKRSGRDMLVTFDDAAARHNGSPPHGKAA